MPDVTDEELLKEIEKILKKADLSKVSTKKVVQQLEEHFDVELRDRKASINKMVMDYVNNMELDDDDDDEKDEDDKDDEEEEEEEEVVVPKKRAKKARKATSDESEEDDSNDSEYEAKKPKPRKQAAKGKKAAGAKGGGGRGKGGGYTRAYKLSPALADLMGSDKMPRHEVVKRMWAIIKEKQLYDPNNKQFAICDDPLYKVVGTKRFRIFGMMKYLKSHFLDD